jgi:hypothetical protein
MSTAKSVIATFATCSALIGTTCHGTASGGYASVNSGDILKLQASPIVESLNLNRSIAITLRGGHDPTFTAVTGMTAIYGTLTISAGTVTIENISIQ